MGKGRREFARTPRQRGRETRVKQKGGGGGKRETRLTRGGLDLKELDSQKKNGHARGGTSKNGGKGGGLREISDRSEKARKPF